MKVSVDQEGCIGCGMCEQTAPEVFVLEGGTAQVQCDTVAPHLEESVKQAATQCPVLVIHVDE